MNLSVEGFRENTKNGGAHETTHELVELANECPTNPNNRAVLPNEDCSSLQVNTVNQNGEKRVDDSDCGCLPQHLHFLAEGLDNYNQSLVENNAEWLKSRCKPTDAVSFDSSDNVSINVPLSSLTSIPGSECPQGDGIVSLDPVTELSLCNDPGSFTDEASILLTENDTVDTQVQMQSSISATSNQTIAATSLDTCGQSVVLPLLPASSDGDLLGFETGNKDLHSVLTNIMSIYGKDNRLGDIVSHEHDELEPVTSLELNDRVGTGIPAGGTYVHITAKDEVITIAPVRPGCDLAGTMPTCTFMNNFQTHQSNNNIVATPTMNSNILHTDPLATTATTALVNVQSENMGTSAVTSLSVEPNEQLLQGNLNLSTISISNDKASNSTKILVDTSEGQQLYELNLAALTCLARNINTQAGTANQQITDTTSESLVPNEESRPNDTSCTYQTKQGVNPGVVLLPVREQDGTNTGMLVTVPASQHGQTGLLKESKFIKSKKMYLCAEPDCGKMFSKISDLSVHHMSHSGLRPYKCTAEGCDWAFTTIYKLKRHEESHRGKKNFVCPVCQKKYTTVYNLRSHVKLHDRPCTESCPHDDCGLKFSTKRQLAFHIKSAHNGNEKLFKCPVEGCEKLFYSEHCMGSHPRVHQQEQIEFVCDFEDCGRKFDKMCRLKQHQRMHTGEKPFVCHFEGCDWAFTTASKLTRHIVKHTGNRKWICKTCGRAFMRAEHLKGHMITHSGLKPFLCPIEGCQCKFAARSSLYVHMKKHNHTSDDITYHCPMESCDRKYATKANLRSHILKHFPGCLTPEDAAQLNIVPLMEKGNKEAETRQQEQLPALPSNYAVSVKTAADGTITVNPADLMDPAEHAVKTEAHYTAELTAPLSTKVATADATTSPPSQPRIMPKKGETSDNLASSARTDYRSNQLLSDRARKRRKLLKEKAGGSEVAPAEASNGQNVEVTSANKLAGTEGLSPQGITFRDPQTGVLYVQMQLLQDDPPHPEMYAEDGMLNNELSLPSSSDSDMADPGEASSEFVGSTINLQDLVG